MLDNISCSTWFFSVDGIDLDYGLITSYLEKAKLNKKMFSAA
jgi:DeoR/GlpR family transcriptional regulator of sugar metabolism